MEPLIDLDYTPPQAIEAENAVLGSILKDQEAFETVAEILRGDEFFPEKHRIIYQAALNIYDAGEPIDVLTVTRQLKDQGKIDDVGGPVYLYELTNAVPTTKNVLSYAKDVKEKHVQRLAILELHSQLQEAIHGVDTSKLITRMQTGAEQFTDQVSPKKDFQSMKTAAMDCFDNIEKTAYAKKNGQVTGIPSGFAELDRMTAGFQKPDLIIIAARPSVGKTAFALNIAQYVGAKVNETVAMFSLEMGTNQLVQRMICAEGNIDANRIRTGNLLSDDWEKITMAIGTISDAPIYIDDSPSVTVADIRAKCRRLKKEKGLGLILIDYLQLIQGNGRKANRQEEVSEISRTLKQIARELDVPVIALSQLSRSVEQRQDKRPIMSDLRDSGSIEQDADIVAFLYRDDYYDRESEKKGIIEIIISKQRNGPTGVVELAFLKQYGKFVSLDRGHQEQKYA